MTFLIISAVFMTALMTAILIWVTNKAYSKKWDHDSDEKRGQF